MTASMQFKNGDTNLSPNSTLAKVETEKWSKKLIKGATNKLAIVYQERGYKLREWKSVYALPEEKRVDSGGAAASAGK